MGRKRKWQRTGFGAMLDHYRVLQSVAGEYDLKMLQVEGENGVFRINTSQGWKKFKPFKYSAPELEFVSSALEHLVAKGWKRSLPLHLTKEGATYVETPYGLFYVTIWVQGTEMNPEDPFQLEASVKLLGEMHRLLEDFRGDTECHRLYPVSWQDKYRRQGEDLLRYQQLAEDKRKNKFSRRFRQVADDFLRMTGIGLQLLEDGDYGRVSRDPDLSTICHTSPIASNLIVGHDGKVYVIDFDNARRDLRIYDVARMMIRHGDWDVDKALFILRNYQEANPLSKEEIALIPALCALSNRGWQVARSFYERDRPYLGRLEAAVEEVAKQDAFVKALVKIQPGDLVHRPQQIFQTIPYPEHSIASETPLAIPMIADEPVDIIDQEASGFVTAPVVDQEPFYWGDAHGEASTGDLVDVGLVEMGQRVAQLAEQLDHMLGAMHGMGLLDQSESTAETSGILAEQDMENELGEDFHEESLEAGIVEGTEILVEMPLATDGEGLVIPTVATGEASGPALEVETEVYEALGYLGYHDQGEGEVRLNIAADMGDVSKEISMETSVYAEEGYSGVDGAMGADIPVLAVGHLREDEPIDTGVEIPVVYSHGIESDTEEVLAEQYTGPSYYEEQMAREAAWHRVVINPEVKLETQVGLGGTTTQLQTPRELETVDNATSDARDPGVVSAEVTSSDDSQVKDNLASVADTVQSVSGEALKATSNPDAVDHGDKAQATDSDVVDDDVQKVSSGDLQAHPSVEEPERSVESIGEPTVQEQSWGLEVVGESNPEPKSAGVVRWGDFPEPLGRRRSRGRRTV